MKRAVKTRKQGKRRARTFRGAVEALRHPRWTKRQERQPKSPCIAMDCQRGRGRKTKQGSGFS